MNRGAFVITTNVAPWPGMMSRVAENYYAGNDSEIASLRSARACDINR